MVELENTDEIPEETTLDELCESFRKKFRRRPIVCLCGSTRFREAFEEANREFTMAGWVVLSVGCFVGSGDPVTEEQKVSLDALHKDKISMADFVFVLNVDRYIGESTWSEVQFAWEKGKWMNFLEPWDGELS